MDNDDIEPKEIDDTADADMDDDIVPGAKKAKKAGDDFDEGDPDSLDDLADKEGEIVVLAQ